MIIRYWTQAICDLSNPWMWPCLPSLIIAQHPPWLRTKGPDPCRRQPNYWETFHLLIQCWFAASFQVPGGGWLNLVKSLSLSQQMTHTFPWHLERKRVINVTLAVGLLCCRVFTRTYCASLVPVAVKSISLMFNGAWKELAYYESHCLQLFSNPFRH